MRKNRFRNVGAPKGFSPHQRKKFILNILFFNQKQLCYWCNQPIFFSKKQISKSATIDHVKPRSKGGTDDVENLVAACMDCNSKKGHQVWKRMI